MARKTLINVERTGEPSIIVAGTSTLEGRMSTLLRIRPTVVERVKRISVGPLYLIIEHALEQLCERAENGQQFMIYAEKMSPGPADKAIMERARDDQAAA